MRILGPIVLPSPAIMQVVGAEIEGCCAVGPQIIRDQSIRNDGVFPQKFAHQFQRGVLVALGLDQHIQKPRPRRRRRATGKPCAHRFSDRPRQDHRVCAHAPVPVGARAVRSGTKRPLSSKSSSGRNCAASFPAISEIRVDDKLDRARNISRVGAPFANDVRRAVQELDSVLHRSGSPKSQRPEICACGFRRALRRPCEMEPRLSG